MRVWYREDNQNAWRRGDLWIDGINVTIYREDEPQGTSVEFRLHRFHTEDHANLVIEGLLYLGQQEKGQMIYRAVRFEISSSAKKPKEKAK